MMLGFCCLVLGLSILPAFANETKQVIDVAIGSKVTIPCQMTNGFNRCHWLHNTTIYSDHPANNSNPAGYSIVGNPNNGNCSLEIDSIKFADDGTWICFMPTNTGEKLVDLTVLVPPASNTLFIDDRPLEPGESTTVRPDPNYGQVRVKCISSGGKPAPKISWEVDGILEEAEESLESSNMDDQTVNVSSTLTLQYQVFTDQNKTVYQIESGSEREKIVHCIVNHKMYKDPAILKAVLGTEYATTICQLNVQKRQDNDTYVLLNCEANGVPEPTYIIQKITPDNDIIELVLTGQNHSITESGIYICEATYQDGHSVRSAQVEVNIRKPEEKTTPDLTANTKTTRDWGRIRNFGNSIVMDSARTTTIYTLVILSIILRYS